MKKPIKCHAKMELRTLEKCQSHALKYAETVVGFWRNNTHLFPRRIPKIVHREYSRRQTRAKLQPRIKYLSAWLCIHAGEGAWNANTGNGYYGGLQMDYGFMSTYGGHLLRSKGTADNWTPAEQMMVAERAHDSGRGFYPWPNTARKCGLI
jgi:Transglycosylase-like domain